MSGRVELDFHVLRRRDVPSSDSWGSLGPCTAWLQSQLHAFVQRHSADLLIDNLLGPSGAWGRPQHVVEHIRDLIESGWIEVAEYSPSRASDFHTPGVEEAAVELWELLPPEDSTQFPEPTHEESEYTADPATTAQISTLVAAAKSGTSFCEVCVAEPTPEPNKRLPDPATAAQISALVGAAKYGASLCEVCT